MACTQGSLQIALVAPLAFSPEETRTAGAHGDPGEGHHQDPWRAGNKADPSAALSSPAFLPPSCSHFDLQHRSLPVTLPPAKFRPRRPRVLSSRPTSASSRSPPSPHPPVKPVLLVIKTSRWPVIPLTNGGGPLGGKRQMRVYRHGPSITALNRKLFHFIMVSSDIIRQNSFCAQQTQ